MVAVDEYPIDTVKVRLRRNFSVHVGVTILWEGIVGGLRKPCMQPRCTSRNFLGIRMILSMEAQTLTTIFSIAKDYSMSILPGR